MLQSNSETPGLKYIFLPSQRRPRQFWRACEGDVVGSAARSSVPGVFSGLRAPPVASATETYERVVWCSVRYDNARSNGTPAKSRSTALDGPWITSACYIRLSRITPARYYVPGGLTIIEAPRDRDEIINKGEAFVSAFGFSSRYRSLARILPFFAAETFVIADGKLWNCESFSFFRNGWLEYDIWNW